MRAPTLGLIALPLLLAVGLCAAVVLVGLRLSTPRPAVIGPAPPSLPEAERVEIPSGSGSLLRGWWLAGQPQGGAVVLMHGVWENRLRMLRRAEMLHANGFAVLLFDLQGHGESSGSRITFGRLEGLDAAAAVAFVRGRAPGERVGAIGTSLGGAAALLGPEALDVQALVLESVYPDIDAALANRLRVGLGPLAGALLVPILTPLFTLLLPPVLGVTASELRPIDRIGEVRAALLVASGTEDTRTTIAEARALFASATADERRFWAVEGAAHVDLEQYDPPQYWAVVLPFLTRNLQPNRAATQR